MRGIGEGCLLTCIYSRLRPVREHVPHDVVVDADERLHDGIGRRELTALREREQVEQFLQRQTDVLFVGPGRDDALDEALRRDVMLVVGQFGRPRYGVVECPQPCEAFSSRPESLKLHVSRRGILEMMHRDGLHLPLLAFNVGFGQSMSRADSPS